MYLFFMSHLVSSALKRAFCDMKGTLLGAEVHSARTAFGFTHLFKTDRSQSN